MEVQSTGHVGQKWMNKETGQKWCCITSVVHKVCVCVCEWERDCTCSRGLMVKLPAVGFMQDTYWTLCISFKSSLLRSYLGVQTHTHTHKQINHYLTVLHAHGHKHIHTHTDLAPQLPLSWRGSVASSFLSISYLKSSQHMCNGWPCPGRSALLTQWNHVQNGLTASEMTRPSSLQGKSYSLNLNDPFLCQHVDNISVQSNQSEEQSHCWCSISWLERNPFQQHRHVLMFAHT